MAFHSTVALIMAEMKASREERTALLSQISQSNGDILSLSQKLVDVTHSNFVLQKKIDDLVTANAALVDRNHLLSEEVELLRK